MGDARSGRCACGIHRTKNSPRLDDGNHPADGHRNYFGVQIAVKAARSSIVVCTVNYDIRSAFRVL